MAQRQTIVDRLLAGVDLSEEQRSKLDENWSKIRIVGTQRVYEGLLATAPDGSQFLVCPATQWQPRKTKSINVFQHGEAAAPGVASQHFNVYNQPVESKAPNDGEEEEGNDAGQE